MMTDEGDDKSDEAPVARFAVESKKLKQDFATPKLFEPTRNLELSVYRIQNLSNQDVIHIGIGVAKTHPTSKALYGWAELARSAIIEVGLSIDDDDNPKGHSTVIGWPEEVSKRKRYQQELASRAAPHLLNPAVNVG